MKAQRLALFSLFVFAVLPSLAVAQRTIVPNDYGTSGTNITMIPGASFIPSSSLTGYAKPFLFLVRTGGGDSEFTHNLTLPPGALIQNITAYVVDSSAAEDVTLRWCVMTVQSDTGATPNIFCNDNFGINSEATTGSPGTTSLTIGVNRTFFNRGDPGFPANIELSYVILVHLGSADTTTQLHSVRVTWRRQISPAPGTATFADVPTSHLFYQFIEALAASGITAGCTAPPNPSYCPDAPLTRGQMAVFLSRGLGLHWVP